MHIYRITYDVVMFVASGSDMGSAVVTVGERSSGINGKEVAVVTGRDRSTKTDGNEFVTGRDRLNETDEKEVAVVVTGGYRSSDGKDISKDINVEKLKRKRKGVHRIMSEKANIMCW